MIFEIIDGTEQFEKIQKAYNWPEQFNDAFKAEFKEIIGTDFMDNCSTSISLLMLEHIPEGTESQFCRNKTHGEKCEFYTARVNSKLNKDYLELIKKYNIEDYDLTHFVWTYIPFDASRNLKKIHKLFKRYFLETKDDPPEWVVHQLKGVDFLIEMPEVEFLRLKADVLEQMNKKSA